MTQEDFLKLERFADRKSILIHESIHNKLNEVPLEKVQHASGCFVGLGTKKLALLSLYRDPQNLPSMEELSGIDGYSDISAKAYLEGIGPFWNFLNKLPISISPYRGDVASDGPLSGMRMCFTGFRDKGLEATVELSGGKIVSGVNGKTTHLVAKDIEGKSSKLKKAKDLGLILWTQQHLQEFLQDKGITST
jgi:DNA ligase (NAD+)